MTFVTQISVSIQKKMSNSKFETSNNTKSSSLWAEVARFFSFTSDTEIKYCTVYTDSNTYYKYFCYKNEICCKTGNGCCPQSSSNRYLESWAFWLCIFFIILAIYLICWYCKKLEKSRNSRALRLLRQSQQRSAVVQQSRNIIARGGNSRCGAASRDQRPSRHAVDRLLENLIRDYRTRLGTDEPPLVHPLPRPTAPDRNRHKEAPPKYIDALSMPKPDPLPRNVQENDRNLSPSGRSTEDGSTERRNFVIIDIISNENVPTYEEATRTHFT